MRQSAPSSDRRDDPSLASAHRLLWLAIAFSILAFGVGAAWDRAWHATHPFEDFWSPPHLFIYATHAIATLLVARIALSHQLRRWFGEDRPIPLLRIALPAPILLVAGGAAVITLAGALDSVWHGAFGLDETAWSLPHSMLGSGILLSLLGFVAARLALSAARPLASWMPAVFAVVLLGTITGVFLGPLDNNHSLQQVRALADLPALRAEPAFQHTVRIYEAWNLTRSHPVFVPLSAFVVAVGLALARRLTGRTWVLVVVAALATLLATNNARGQARYLGIEDDARNWLPLPFVVPALVLAALSLTRMDERWTWRAAGLAYGVVTAAWWPGTALGALLAAPLMAVGARLGERLAGIVSEPGRNVPALLLILGVVVPVLTGALDLALRLRTP